MTALLVTSGLWAVFVVGRLVAPLGSLKVAFYTLGLVLGLSAVGAWLYFCSAYVGASFHRRPRYRWLALTGYLSIVAVKLTNPIHGAYFSARIVESPFRHLVIELGIAYWLVIGLAYALSAVGFYLLFDLFRESSYTTTRLGPVVALAGLPAVFTVISSVSPGLIVPIGYDSIGVALFALGALYVADGSFLAVRQFGREQIFDELTDGIVILDTDRTVRDTNEAARRLFPALADGRGESIGEVVPEIETYLPVERSHLVDPANTESTEYYLLSGSELTAGQTTIGHALTFTDVTEVERQRRKVERQHAQFDDFADAITHELRNTINIVRGHLETAETRLDSEADPVVSENIDTAVQTTDRMTQIVENLSTLARFGRAVEQTSDVDIDTIARRAWETSATGSQRLTITADATVEADPTRLELLLERLFEFSIANGASELEIDGTDTEIVLTDDGTPLADEQVTSAFAYGEAVPDAIFGMALPIVQTIAEAHGWGVTVDTTYTDGVRIRIEM